MFTNIILLWIRNFEKNRTTPTPKKTKKTQKKDMDFLDGISCQLRHFFPEHVAFVSEITKEYREVVNYLLKKWLH